MKRSSRENRKNANWEPEVGTKPDGSDLTFREAVQWFLTTHCKTLRENFYEGRLSWRVDFFNHDREREIKVSEVTSDMIS